MGGGGKKEKKSHARTSPRYVFSTLPFTILAAPSLPGATNLQVMIGVLIFFAALMISLIRGTPSVTFMLATPAKWNVLSVICVPGSPIDCAPTAPTVEPARVRGGAVSGEVGWGWGGG